MNPTCKDPARPSRSARVGARSNTRAREVRRGRGPHGGTAKTQPAAHPRKQRSQTPNLGGPKSPMTLDQNLP